jgi:mRNA interferase MazF
MEKIIIALITSNLRRSGQDTQYVLNRTHPDFTASGLHRESVVNCSNLYTVLQSDVTRVIGTVTDGTMRQIDACLKAALGIR